MNKQVTQTNSGHRTTPLPKYQGAFRRCFWKPFIQKSLISGIWYKCNSPYSLSNEDVEPTLSSFNCNLSPSQTQGWAPGEILLYLGIRKDFFPEELKGLICLDKMNPIPSFLLELTRGLEPSFTNLSIVFLLMLFSYSMCTFHNLNWHVSILPFCRSSYQSSQHPDNSGSH
jgi:hypothetical protein